MDCKNKNKKNRSSFFFSSFVLFLSPSSSPLPMSVTFQGSAVALHGVVPAVGSALPECKLTTGDLQTVGFDHYKGKVLVVNCVPSLDTGVCAASARRFEKESGALGGVVILTVSADLPFAQSRFCHAEGVTHVVPLSTLRDKDCHAKLGIAITSGPLEGLCSRAVFVADKNGVVQYSQIVQEITHEPNYTEVLNQVKKLL